MKDEYQKKLNQIHAPKELIEQTKLEMRKELAKEQRKIKITITLKRSALAGAALILIVVGGYDYYSSQNQLNVASVSDTSFSVDHNFGKITDDKETKKDEQITISQGTNKELVPEFLSEVKPSKIKGVAVQLGLDDKGQYHAAYKLDDQYYYVIGKEVTEKEFVTYLKRKL